jgi:2-C-methyl-D-erythritol 4-phosphate cytidylyltransferase
MNVVAILANGVGARFGSNVPKQFHRVNGKMVIEYVIESIAQSSKTDKLVIATNVEANSVYLADACAKYNIDLIEGGDTRNQTLKYVINYIESKFDCDKLIVCDAVRPMITAELMDKYFDFLDNNEAVVTAQKITDSLGCYNFQKVNRDDYYLMQSPEGFDFKLLAESFDENSELTEVTQQLPADSKIKLYFDFTNNFKLTYPADLKYLEALIKEKNNNVDFSDILQSVIRLKTYLEVNYPNKTEEWIETLKEKFPTLLKKWQIENYRLIKTSHFGIVFLANSIKYGKCVIKIIPPFIDRYKSERACYQNINSIYMCELYDFDDNCSSLLLERCNDVQLSFDKEDKAVLDFFERVVNSQKTAYKKSDFNDYKTILENKLSQTDFDCKKDIIMSYVKKAVDEYNRVFVNAQLTLIHGDLHRYNIMNKNDKLVAIDPIGYIAPREFDIARYIGTELSDGDRDVSSSVLEMLDYFSPIADREKLKSALFIDIVFRLHNSLFENEDYILTDKWIKILEQEIFYEIK